MKPEYIAILATLVALIVSMTSFPLVLRFAKHYNIVDNPNARKLQRRPVPVMGGVVIYLGLMTGGAVIYYYWPSQMLLWGMIAMSVMMLIGVCDDIKDISVGFRFMVEIGIVAGLIGFTGFSIDSLHGLFGIEQLPVSVAWMLSILAGVGIINAINLIDGVDGYSSGYGIMACVCFATMGIQVCHYSLVCLAVVAAASILPFFLHNVFGLRSKMYMGDGGTLMLGVLMVIFVFLVLSSEGRYNEYEAKGLGLAAFTLSVLCIPVFDTLRVMCMRMARGRSPFSPDKTHLHHLFIDMGFSHIGTALTIVFINACVVGLWFLSWKLGLNPTWQAVVVVLLGLMVTFGFYHMMRVQQSGGGIDEEGYPMGGRLWHLARKVGEKSHFEKGKLWHLMTRIMDSRLLL